MSRKKSSDENKFAVLLKGLVAGSAGQFDDPDLIDVEAEDVEDYAALPPAKARMLPPGAAPPKRGRLKSVAKEAIAPSEDPSENSSEDPGEDSAIKAANQPTEASTDAELDKSVDESVDELSNETITEASNEAPNEASVEASVETPIIRSEKPAIERLKPRPWGKSRLEVQPVYDEDGNRKKGRPAKGKRSDGDWAGRTYYVRYTTDTKLEKALWKLRREGLDVDKSDLTDALLNAWAQVELGEVADSGFGNLVDRVIDQAIDRD